jgi:Flp pilus assembly protein TadB
MSKQASHCPPKCREKGKERGREVSVFISSIFCVCVGVCVYVYTCVCSSACVSVFACVCFCVIPISVHDIIKTKTKMITSKRKFKHKKLKIYYAITDRLTDTFN